MAINTQDIGPVIDTRGPEAQTAAPIPKDAPTDPRQVTTAEPADRTADKNRATAQIQGDPAALAEVARLSKRLRELEKIDVNGLREKASKFEAIEKAPNELRKLEALGIDIDKVVTQAMEEGKDPAVAAKRAAEAAIKEETKRLEDEIENLKKDRETDKMQATATEQAEAKAALVGQFGEMAKTDVTRWPYAAKLGSEAAGDAYAVAESAMKALGRAVSDVEARQIMEASLDQVDAYHRDRAKLYGVSQDPTRESARTRPPRTITGDIRSSGGPSAPSSPSRKFVTAEQAKQEAIERIRAARR